jgi:hypothetical protein
MKRAKMMLTALAVFAVVGGALAFNAKKFGQANVFCKIDNVCQPQIWTTTNADPLARTTNDPCLQEAVFYTDNTCSTPIAETTVYESFE